MVEIEGETFSKRVQHFATCLRGTNAYWFKQRNRLTAMVFFTHSAADMQWPELAHLIFPYNPTDKTCRKQAVIENPAIADWFFYQRIQHFAEYF